MNESILFGMPGILFDTLGNFTAVVRQGQRDVANRVASTRRQRVCLCACPDPSCNDAF